MFAKSLQMQLVVGAIKRLEILKNEPQHREKLYWGVGVRSPQNNINTHKSYTVAWVFALSLKHI